MKMVRRFKSSDAAFVTALGLAGCTLPAEDPDPGTPGGLCVKGECFGELVCEDDICVEPGGSSTGGVGDQTGETGAGSPDGTGDSGGPTVDYEAVSILVVMDNSGSMGDEQLEVTRALQALPTVLDQAGIDWRLAVTTTDSGNPWCQGSSPENGRFVLSSCRSRLQDFVFEGTAPALATTSCTDICPEQWETISTVPSVVEDGSSQPRPWIECVDGQDNLPDGLSLSDAIGCLIPQGINGCGFEQPLASASSALEYTQHEPRDEWGFFDERSLPVVLIVTDEADCSYNSNHETIFLPDGARVFWSDPTAISPTSAVCWNAGVVCDGPDCSSANKDRDGSIVADAEADEDAVLIPLDRYRAQLDALGSPLVMVIGGSNSDGSVTYQSGVDPEFEAQYGIGPGCFSSAGFAAPPVRLRELTEGYAAPGHQNLHSICDSDHAPAIDMLIDAIVDRLR